MKHLLFFCFYMPTILFANNKLQYNIYYNNALEKEGLKIEVSYTHNSPQDSTVLYLVNRSWGEQNLLNTIILNKSENNGYNCYKIPDKFKLVFQHPKSKTVKLTYRIRQDYDNNDYNIFHRPRVQNEYFQILGHSFFAVPFHLAGGYDNPLLNITINWIGFPGSFKIHNSFGTQQTTQKLKIHLWDELYHSAFFGGDYRIYNFKVQNYPVYFAIRGQWLNGFTDSLLLHNLQTSIQAQRDFWKDYKTRYYTIIMSPTVTSSDSSFKGHSNTGSGLANGYIIQASNNLFNSLNTYKYLLYHEMMHDWIGGKIKNKYETLNYWFSEGFTDYYTYKNRLRSGDLLFNEWLESFNNEVIKAHFKNPNKNISNYILKDSFWLSRKIEKVPYRRGALFAFWIDNQIMLKSNYTKSLDDLMRDILHECTIKNQKFTDELFLTAVEKYLEKDISYFFQKHILTGVDIDFKNEQWIEGFRFDIQDGIPVLKTDTKPRYIL